MTINSSSLQDVSDGFKTFDENEGGLPERKRARTGIGNTEKKMGFYPKEYGIIF
ncbi:MAG: hypothetical protein ACI9S8_002184 [Chlamydiales bacterium]|jgi:hypothetical protein